MNAKKLFNKVLSEKAELKGNIDVIHVNDGKSRFFGGRFNEDLVNLVHQYDAISTFNYARVSSSMFIELYSKLPVEKETVVILDNVKNVQLFELILKMRTAVYTACVTDNGIDDTDNVTNERIRQLNFRVVYLLDEYVWEGVAGRANSVYDAKVIEDLMNIADTIVVPNIELRSALLDLGLVDDTRKDDVIVMPLTVPATMYQVYAKRTANTLASKIDKPSILIKGVTLTKNLCEFIVSKYKKYRITISSISELPNEVMLLLQNGEVGHIVHYTSPAVNAKNIVNTFTDERDCKFDFVIYSSADLLYDLAAVDSDAIFSIAAGSCVFSCVKDAKFNNNSHVCLMTSTAFSKSDSYNKIDDMLTKYSVTVNWNELYEKQRTYLDDKISDKPLMLGKLFGLIVGKDMVKKKFSAKKA